MNKLGGLRAVLSLLGFTLLPPFGQWTREPEERG